jgi:hypothetical protein
MEGNAPSICETATANYAKSLVIPDGLAVAPLAWGLADILT